MYPSRGVEVMAVACGEGPLCAILVGGHKNLHNTIEHTQIHSYRRFGNRTFRISVGPISKTPILRKAFGFICTPDQPASFTVR